jgi:tetratricopeptide (TPR) repeat protein
LVDEAVADYVAAIVEYGADITQDGVDLMIEELVNINLRWLNEAKRDILLEQLKTALGETDEPVLQLRLRVLMAMITKTEMILGRQLLAELSDFNDVTPPVLSTLCKVSLKEKDYSRAKELLAIFKDKFDDSDYIRDAYKLRIFGLFAEKDYDRTLELLDEVRNRFSTERDMYWAQLKRAELYLVQGKFKDAIDANMAVLGVPAWRGIPVARATYQLGQVEERMGHQGPAAKRDMHLNNAFAYYQRVYYQYKGYAEGYWAAEAYLACARVLKDLGREHDRRNIFRAMLFDRYVNSLPQAEEARKVLGAVEVAEIKRKVEGGAVTNIVVTVATQPVATNAVTTNAVSAGGAK